MTLPGSSKTNNVRLPVEVTRRPENPILWFRARTELESCSNISNGKPTCSKLLVSSNLMLFNLLSRLISFERFTVCRDWWKSTVFKNRSIIYFNKCMFCLFVDKYQVKLFNPGPDKTSEVERRSSGRILIIRATSFINGILEIASRARI